MSITLLLLLVYFYFFNNSIIIITKIIKCKNKQHKTEAHNTTWKDKKASPFPIVRNELQES